VPAGAPVSVLMEHDLSEGIVEKLAIAGIATVEKLGSMTPEELEEIPGIGSKMVEKIFASVNSYYGQFEPDASAPHAPAEEPVEAGQAAQTAESGNLEDPEQEGETTDAAFAHLSVSPSELEDSSHAVSSVREGEFDTIKGSENAG